MVLPRLSFLYQTIFTTKNIEIYFASFDRIVYVCNEIRPGWPLVCHSWFFTLNKIAPSLGTQSSYPHCDHIVPMLEDIKSNLLILKK